jgi:hypothetical protein
MDRLALAISGLALLLVTWNTITLSSMQQQLDAMSARATERPSPPMAAERGPPDRSARPWERRTARSSAPRGELNRDEGEPIDLDAPEVREQIAEVVAAEQQRREEEAENRRSERFLESMSTRVDDFVAAEGLSDDVRSQVMGELRYRHEAFMATRQDVQEGALSWMEARGEFQQLRETSDAKLEELLGADLATRLDEALWGDRDHRRW